MIVCHWGGWPRGRAGYSAGPSWLLSRVSARGSLSLYPTRPRPVAKWGRPRAPGLERTTVSGQRSKKRRAYEGSVGGSLLCTHRIVATGPGLKRPLWHEVPTDRHFGPPAHDGRPRTARGAFPCMGRFEFQPPLLSASVARAHGWPEGRVARAASEDRPRNLRLAVSLHGSRSRQHTGPCAAWSGQRHGSARALGAMSVPCVVKQRRFCGKLFPLSCRPGLAWSGGVFGR